MSVYGYAVYQSVKTKIYGGVDAIITQYTGPTGRLKESPEVLAKAIEPFVPIVGLHVVQHWKLPPELCFATLYAQQPELTLHEGCRLEIHCIKLASDIAESKGYGIGNPDNFSLENHPSLEQLELSQDELNELIQGMDEMIDSVLGMLGSLE